jgi:hypothetical protein
MGERAGHGGRRVLIDDKRCKRLSLYVLRESASKVVARQLRQVLPGRQPRERHGVSVHRG